MLPDRIGVSVRSIKDFLSHRVVTVLVDVQTGPYDDQMWIGVKTAYQNEID